LEHRNVALTQALDNVQEVSLDVELETLRGVLGSGVCANGDTGLGVVVGIVVAALGVAGLATRLRLEQLVQEHTIAPATIVVEEGQRTDGLVEHVEVPGVQQKTLSGHQGLASNLEGAREIGVVRIRRAGVLTQRHKHLVLDDRTAVGSTDRLVLGTLAAGLGAGVTEETVTIQLHGLTRLLGKVVDYDGLASHLHDISRVGAVQFRTQQLGKVVIDEHNSFSAKF